MLFVIYSFDVKHRPLRPRALDRRRELYQRSLRQILGSSHEVISRMLRALVELGWVRRERRGKRRYVVFITRLGRRLMRRLCKHALPQMRRTISRMFSRDHNKALDTFWDFENILSAIVYFFSAKHMHELYPFTRWSDDDG